MKNHYNRSRIIKIFLIAIIIGIVGFTFGYWPEESKQPALESTKIEVPHSFTTEATKLTNRLKEPEKLGVSRLNKYDIRKAVKSTFECRGLKMDENLSLTIDDMVIPLSGYDKELKTGYVLLDFNLFGDGILDKSYTQYKSQQKTEQEFLSQIEMGIELFFEDEEKFLLDVFGEDPYNEEESLDTSEVIAFEHDSGLIEEFKNFTLPTNVNSKERQMFIRHFENFNSRKHKGRRIFSVNVTRNKWNFFEEAYSDPEMLYEFGQEIKDGVYELKIQEDRKEYLEIIFGELKKRIFLRDLDSKVNKTYIDEWMFSAAEKIDDPTRFFGFIERIKYLGIQYSSNPLDIAMDSEILKISLINDKKKWWKHSEALINLLQSNKTAEINSKHEYNLLLAEIINNNPYHKWSEHYYKIDELGNKYTVSLEELQALPTLAYTHGIFIAPLSILDERTIYDMQDQAHNDKLAGLREKINKTDDKDLRKSYQEELLNLSQYRSQHYGRIRDEAKAIPLQRITDDMESFIDWAEKASKEWNKKSGV